MALPKVCGTETEFGIRYVGPGDLNPTTASSLLINAYTEAVAGRIGWDFEDETPGRDARGFQVDADGGIEVETHLVNTVLTNGARFYVDHAHPEYSGPECLGPLEATLYDKAGEVVLQRAMEAVGALLPAGASIVVYKNNSDGKGNSYGAHENYLLDRAVPFAQVVRHVVPHLVTRQIFAGAGKVGSEAPGRPVEEVAFQISQRADFIEEVVGLETTLKRPIVNTRDEPHSDAGRYRRLHVIIGDANLAEVSVLLKVGTTALVLAMVEDGWEPGRRLVVEDPVGATHAISLDASLETTVALADGRRLRALEIQWELFELSAKYVAREGGEVLGGDDVAALVLSWWERVLNGLEHDPASMARVLDWVAKYNLVDAYRERHGLSWASPKLAALDLQYHDLRPGRSLAARLDLERVLPPEAVVSAADNPPADTRAYFRGECLRRWAPSVVAANWDSLVLDVGEDTLRRIPMMDPLRGTQRHVEALLEECATPADLVRRLGA
jgi:proteasome accessory factor PafA2